MRSLGCRCALVYHHERWDGTGYPEGLRAKRFRWGARIVAVVDAYTAMSDPTGKPSLWIKHLKSFSMMWAPQFDPRRSCGIPTRSEEWRIPLMAEASLWLRYAHFADCV